MSRNVSDAFKEAVFAQETDEAFYLLITISHPGISPSVRVVADSGVDITSRGDLFKFMPVEVDLPGDLEDNEPQAALRIDNVDQVIIKTLRTLTSPPQITLELVRAGDLDTVEVLMPEFELRQVDYDALVISGVLQVQDLTTEPWPCYQFTPNYFRNLF